MFIAVPRDAENEITCGSGPCLEMEVVPGECVYTNQMNRLPRGVFVPWNDLTADQQKGFLAIQQELQKMTDKLKAMFLTVGDVVADA